MKANTKFEYGVSQTLHKCKGRIRRRRRVKTFYTAKIATYV
jgi:hypothetical protein